MPANNTTHNWNATLAEMYDVVYKQLAHQLPAEQASDMALQVLVALSDQVLGGTQPYFPKSDSINRAARDRQIWHQFDGHNTKNLAIQHGISERQVYYIIAEQRALHISRTQDQLFYN